MDATFFRDRFASSEERSSSGMDCLTQLLKNKPHYNIQCRLDDSIGCNFLTEKRDPIFTISPSTNRLKCLPALSKVQSVKSRTVLTFNLCCGERARAQESLLGVLFPAMHLDIYHKLSFSTAIASDRFRSSLYAKPGTSISLSHPGGKFKI